MSKFFLVVYIFCFLFAPPIVPGINFSFILGGVSLFMLLTRYHKRLMSLIRKRAFQKYLLLLGVYIFILLLSFLINSLFRGENIYDNFLINLYSVFLNFFVTFICGFYLVFKCEDLGVNKHEIMKLFIYAGLLQSAISLFALVNSGFRDFTIGLMIKDTNASLMNSPWLLERRFFGLSNNLLDLFGFGTGIIATLPLFYASAEKKWRYLFAIPLLLVVCILNSRSGILVFFIGLAVWCAGLLVSKRVTIMGMTLGAIASILIAVAGINMVSWLSPSTMEWISNDFTSFMDPENNEGTASVIYSDDFWILPDADQILIGSGHNVSAYSSNKVEGVIHTDNGYANEIWKVGLVGLVIYFWANYYILEFCYKSEKMISYKSMYIFFGLSMLVFSIKGSLIGYNPGNAIIYTCFIYSILKKEKYEEE